MGFQNFFWNRTKVIPRFGVAYTLVIRPEKKGEIAKAIRDEIILVRVEQGSCEDVMNFDWFCMRVKEFLLRKRASIFLQEMHQECEEHSALSHHVLGQVVYLRDDGI